MAKKVASNKRTAKKTNLKDTKNIEREESKSKEELKKLGLVSPSITKKEAKDIINQIIDSLDSNYKNNMQKSKMKAKLKVAIIFIALAAAGVALATFIF
jgi:hypothetical protein